MGRHLNVIVICLITFFAAPRAIAAPFVYQPFPDLPSTTVIENSLASSLRSACEVLAATPALTLAPTCPAVAAPPAKSAALSQQIASARSLPAAAGAAPCSAQAQVDLNAVVAYVGELKAVCAKLRAQPPVALSAAAGGARSDVDVLRDARDAPEILDIVKRWSKSGTSADFRAALSTGGGKVASDIVPGAPSLGSISDQLIRGMAEFLAKRAQEEALRYLRDELRKQLCGDEGPEPELRKATFSNTCSALDTLDDGMSLEAIGSYLRAAAEKDLRKLPDLGLAYAEQRVPTKANLTFAGRLGLKYYDAVRRGREPFEVLYSLGELQAQPCETASSCANASKAVRLTSALAYALRQGGTEWQELYDAEKLAAQDRPVVAVAIALLVEARLAALGPGRNLGFGLTTLTVGQVNALIVEPLALVSEAVALAKSWQSLEERLGDKLSDEARREALIQTLLQSSERISRMVETFDRLLNGGPSPNVTDAMAKTRAFVGVAASLISRDYAGAIVAARAELAEITGAASVKGSMTKYLPLIVEIASAHSSNEVAAAFDAYAAPIGTYKLKYKKPMISINGFLGAHAGWERLDSGGVEATSTILGGFAPVGIHASYPVCDCLHLGVLLSVLDLGAVTTTKTDTEDQPEGALDGADPATQPKAAAAAQIGFEQVFSPGAYVVAGLGGSPFTLGFGLSLSPELRRVTQDGLETEESVLRYGGFLAVDVPILPFD